MWPLQRRMNGKRKKGGSIAQSVPARRKKPASSDDEMDPVMREWVYIPMVIAVAAIVAVGIPLSLAGLSRGLPTWVYGGPGIVAVAIYYGLKLRHLWFANVKPALGVQAGGQIGSQKVDRGSAAFNVKGKGNTTNIIMQGPTPPNSLKGEETKPAQGHSDAVLFRITDVSAARWEPSDEGRTLAFNFEAINAGTAGSAPHEVEVYWPGYDHQKRTFSGRVLRAASHNLNGGLLLPAGDRATFTAHVRLPTGEAPPAKRAFLVVRPVRGAPTDPFSFSWP